MLYQSFLVHVFFRTTEWISVNLGPGFVLNVLDVILICISPVFI
jgi:hypothetical protein